MSKTTAAANTLFKDWLRRKHYATNFLFLPFYRELKIESNKAGIAEFQRHKKHWQGKTYSEKQKYITRIDNSANKAKSLFQLSIFAGTCHIELTDYFGRNNREREFTIHLKQAEKYFQRSIKNDKYQVEGYFYLGQTYAIQGNQSKALKCFNQALELDPYDNRVVDQINALNSIQNSQKFDLQDPGLKAKLEELKNKS